VCLEDRIRKLAEDIIACRDEAEAVILTRNLGIALHEHIKQLRHKLCTQPNADNLTNSKAA
jgi:hypothetical protein